MFRNEAALFEFRGPWGVPVQIGSSLLLLILIFLLFSSTVQELYYDFLFLVILLVSIFLHELGHAWGALIQGRPVRRIMIYGGGGFCERDRPAPSYEEELIVAMGPIVTAVLWAGAVLIGPFLPPGDLAWAVHICALVNFFLLIFNMLPVMPLDGGKLLHLGLQRVMRLEHATRLCGAVGLVTAVLWLPLMIFSFHHWGLLLLFVPPILIHWRMLRRAA